jgi:hypothetical protein
MGLGDDAVRLRSGTPIQYDHPYMAFSAVTVRRINETMSTRLNGQDDGRVNRSKTFSRV